MKPIAPFVFVPCPTCKGRRRHVTMISSIPSINDLTEEQTGQIREVAANYVADVRNMCAKHRQELGASCYWPGGRPPDEEIIRHPFAVPEGRAEIERRHDSCWLAEIKMNSTIWWRYQLNIYASADSRTTH